MPEHRFGRACSMRGVEYQITCPPKAVGMAPGTRRASRWDEVMIPIAIRGIPTSTPTG